MECMLAQKHNHVTTKDVKQMGNNNSNIQMRLTSVSEMKFSMDQNIISGIDDFDIIQLGFQNTVFPDVKKNVISINFGVQYSYNGNVALESVYKFSFYVENLTAYVEVNNNSKLLIKNIMPHMLSVAVGTMRGVIVVKAIGTELSKYPLPMINIMRLNDKLSAVTP